MDHITELRGRIATLQSQRAEMGQQSAGYAVRSDLTDDDRTAWDAIRDRITANDADQGRINTAIEQEENSLRQSASRPQNNGSGGNNPPPEQRQEQRPETRTLRMYGNDLSHDGRREMVDVVARRDANLVRYLRTGQGGTDLEDGGSEYRFERRAFQADSLTEGGYLSNGELNLGAAALIQAVDNATFMRQRGTVRQVPVGFTSLGAPSLDTDAEDSDWTTELSTGNEEDTLRVGRRSLTPHPMAKFVKESRELIRAAPDFESILLGRIGYKFGITAEKGYLTGTGAQQALGVFTASADGISTGRDVSTGNLATAIQTDGIIEAQYTLKAAYWSRAAWMFHRDGVKQIAKLKDGEGRYLWEPSIRQGDPDLLRGFPIMVSEYAPNTFTSGLYVGLFGDFSYYWIADSMEYTIQRLIELYALTNQVGFIGRMQTDGMPVLEEAFVRVKLG